MLLKTIILCTMFFAIKVSCDDNHCHNLLNSLANKQKDLLGCITVHSVPVSMCIACISSHDAVLEAYDLLSADCSSMYFDKDRINLVASTESALTGLWSRAYCDDCFNNNNIFTFMEKNTTFYTCVEENKPDVCEECKSEYTDLNNFYINLDQHNNGEVCFDMQDSVNRSRNFWSKESKCCRREYNMKFFTMTLCITSCLPLLFYGSTYLLTKRQERNHDLLNNEDPLYNSSPPSTSRQTNINNINNLAHSMENNPTTTNINNLTQSMENNPSTSTVNNNSATIKPSERKNFNILNEDLESSDDEMKN